MSEGRKIIPPELENLLLEFTINVIVENPTDIVSHAAEYFTRLRDNPEIQAPPPPEGSKDEISKVLAGRTMRRGTVMGERYNPEEDDDTETEVEVHPKTDEQKQRIKEKCKDIFLFKILDQSDVGAVIDAMIPKPISAGEVVIKQGDDGDFFYLIDTGIFDIYIKDNSGEDKYVDSYQGEGYFGELALLHNQPRAATIKANTDGFIWAVGRTTFNRLIVKRAFQKRQTYMKLLENVPQLKPLSEYEKMQVADALESKTFDDGVVIFLEGDEGDGMYFIVEGKVSVRKRLQFDEVNDEEVAQLNAGEYFGEMAVVEHQPRAATVVAIGETKVAFLDVKAFERLLGPCMDIMKRHMKSYK